MLGEGKRKMSAKIAIGDADSLVALTYQGDANHLRAMKINQWLLSEEYEIVYPNTAILEAITALRRSLNLVNEAHAINKQYQAGVFLVKFVDKEIQERASLRFENTVSKKNTIFDAIVAATAEKLGADYIFSFDRWYSKEGFTLVKVP